MRRESYLDILIRTARALCAEPHIPPMSNWPSLPMVERKSLIDPKHETFATARMVQRVTAIATAEWLDG